MTPRTGRPRVEDPRTELVTIRLTKAEKAIVEAAAAKAGQKIGIWMRVKLLAIAKRTK